MKRILAIAFALLLWTAGAHAQNTGVRISRYEGVPITAVVATSGFEVEIVRGETTGAVVEIDAELEKYLRFELRDETLTIGLSKEFRESNKLRELFNNSLRCATVTVSSLTSLKATTSARVNVADPFSGGTMALTAGTSARIIVAELTATGTISAKATTSASISGRLNAAEVKLDAGTSARIESSVEAGEVTTDVSTSARITLSGSADSGRFTGNTSARVNAEQLVLRKATARINTSASATLHATESVDISCNTSGRVRYTGGAAIRNVTANTGGRATSF